MSQSTETRGEHALANLRTLLEVNTQMTRLDPSGRLDAEPNDEVQRVISDIIGSAEDHRHSLAGLIHEWESHMRRTRARAAPQTESRLSPRELLESWVAIKESAADLYRKSAPHAPTALIARRLRELAREEEIQAERLRGLL